MYIPLAHIEVYTLRRLYIRQPHRGPNGVRSHDLPSPSHQRSFWEYVNTLIIRIYSGLTSFPSLSPSHPGISNDNPVGRLHGHRRILHVQPNRPFRHIILYPTCCLSSRKHSRFLCVSNSYQPQWMCFADLVWQVEVESATDVAAVLTFAQDWHVPLAVKGTYVETFHSPGGSTDSRMLSVAMTSGDVLLRRVGFSFGPTTSNRYALLYLSPSCARDAWLLQITRDTSFIPDGCTSGSPIDTVTLGVRYMCPTVASPPNHTF